MTLQPMDLSVITRRDPIPESAMDVSSWFVTETLEVQVGEAVGRPSKDVQLSRDFVSYLLGNGWNIVAFTSGQEGGEWTSTSTAVASNSSGSTSNSNSASESLPGGEKTITYFTDIIHGRTDVRTVPVPSRSTTASNGTASTNGQSSTTVTDNGSPYWYAYNLVRLQRRRIKAEAVLSDMVQSFTRAYNEGREVNNARYEEIVACYQMMLSHTETEANSFASLNAESFAPLAERVTSALERAAAEYREAAGSVAGSWQTSRAAEVNRKFDAAVSQAMAAAISNGTYNSSTWAMVAAGFERDRQAALTDLADAMVTLRVDVAGKIAAMTAEVHQKILDCAVKMVEAQQKMVVGPTEIRNTVMKWMLDFMERRDDDYPSMETIASAAERLGYADGGSTAS